MIFPLIIFIVLSIWSIHYFMKHQMHKLDSWKITTIFIYKLIIGCIYGYIFSKYFTNDDTWFIHEGGLEQTLLIKNDFKHFLYQLTPMYSWERAEYNIWAFFPRWLSDIEWNLLRKPLGVINIFSGGNYYVNLCFINIFSFWGLFWIYQIFLRNFPNAKNLLFFIVFFLPTTAFWLSGLRSEPYLIFFVGWFLKWVIYHKKYTIPILPWLGIAVLRIDLAFTLIPFWISLVWWRKDSHLLKRKIAIAYGGFIFLFIVLSLLLPNHYPWKILVDKQAAFFELQGTQFSLTPLTAEFPQWLLAIPQSFINTYLRPFLNEAEGIFQLMSSLSQIAIMASILVFWFIKRKPSICPPYDLKGRAILFNVVVWTVFAYLIIGLVVPFPGAIVRYKIIPELLLITCIAMNWRSKIRPQITTYYKK